MKKINRDRTIQVLANVGVIAGIVFLGLEMQQNNEALDIQARLEREGWHRAAKARQVQNPNLIRALAKARKGETLTDEDAIVLELEGQATLVDWMLVFRLVDDGVIERSSIPISMWRDYFQNPGFRKCGLRPCIGFQKNLSNSWKRTLLTLNGVAASGR